MTKPVIALDGDNVLLDHSYAYAGAWEKAFGRRPAERDPTAYWPIDRWAVERLHGELLSRFRGTFDEEFWSTMPAVAGALEACRSLSDAGFELVCVSAIEPQYESARLFNLRQHGFPIERVVATSSGAAGGNPKAQAIESLMPLAFVDDYLPYLVGLANCVHTALILRQETGSPNVGPDLAHVRSQHRDLSTFARWWLER